MDVPEPNTRQVRHRTRESLASATRLETGQSCGSTLHGSTQSGAAPDPTPHSTHTSISRICSTTSTLLPRVPDTLSPRVPASASGNSAPSHSSQASTPMAAWRRHCGCWSSACRSRSTPTCCHRTSSRAAARPAAETASRCCPAGCPRSSPSTDCCSQCDSSCSGNVVVFLRSMQNGQCSQTANLQEPLYVEKVGRDLSDSILNCNMLCCRLLELPKLSKQHCGCDAKVA